MQELKKTLKEDARLILQLKGAVETVKDQELLFKPEDRDLILQVRVFLKGRDEIVSLSFFVILSFLSFPFHHPLALSL